MPDTLDPEIAAILAEEEQRLVDTCASADQYGRERVEQLRAHQQKVRGLERERIHSNNPREIDKITFEIQRLSQYNPAKYLVPFEQMTVPYLAGITIHDDDPAIGRKHILFGKQSLTLGSKVIVTDWRKAEISKLYYEWEEGEEYEDDIGDRERSGTIEKKMAYGVSRRQLLSLHFGRGRFEKRDGCWADAGQQNVSSAKKEVSADHRMVDIISLISPEQFALITRNNEGCLYLTGGAGCGKTTVALHRLSYLVFNQPELFRPRRCMVVMFNKSLRNYVKKTSVDLLTSQLPVETFHSWAVKALHSFDLTVSFTPTAEAGLTTLKKSSGLYTALLEYVQGSGSDTLVDDLGAFYANTALLQRHLGDSPHLEPLARQGRRLQASDRLELTFDDAGPMILLAQLRQKGHMLPSALGWYDHILVDEAQDLSLVELHALMHATTERRSLTVCADEKQKILDFVDATGFSTFQMELQSAGLSSGELDVSYRSTQQIMALASQVSGRVVGKVVNQGPEPRFHMFNSQMEALNRLRQSVGVLMGREKSSLTAIICRYKHEAMTVYAALKDLPGVRLQTSDLSFEPGLLITNVHQVKGLEFSGVILWNPSQQAYPVTDLGKNLLYVAITRASDRLAVYHNEPLSPLFS